MDFTGEKSLGIKVNPEEWDKKLMLFKEMHQNKNHRRVTRNKNKWQLLSLKKNLGFQED